MNTPRIDQLARVLQRIFDQDPHFNGLIRQDERRSEALLRLFQLLLKEGETHGDVLVSGENEAVLIGFPPGAGKLSLGKQLAFLWAYLPISGWRGVAGRMLGIQKMAWHRPREPHYYVQVIGVDTIHQGKGQGRTLLSGVFARCDGQRWPLYLETANPLNLGFYKKLGFAVNDRYRLPGGLELFGLMRMPLCVCAGTAHAAR